jgi:hypothetical protein
VKKKKRKRLKRRLGQDTNFGPLPHFLARGLVPHPQLRSLLTRSRSSGSSRVRRVEVCRWHEGPTDQERYPRHGDRTAPTDASGISIGLLLGPGIRPSPARVTNPSRPMPKAWPPRLPPRYRKNAATAAPFSNWGGGGLVSWCESRASSCGRMRGSVNLGDQGHCWGPSSSEGPQKHDLTMFSKCNI